MECVIFWAFGSEVQYAFVLNFLLSSKFSTRNRSGTDDNHVVYQFDCPEDCCTQSYIGYTTLTIGARAKQHRYKPSKIHEHFRIEHNKSKIDDISEHFKVLYRNHDVYSLRISEALKIREKRPEINVKFNEMANILNVV